MGVKYFCGATVEVEERPNRNNFVKLVRFCESWPTWPFLPLIHKKEIDTDRLPVLGLLVAKEFTVFETDIFDRNFENPFCSNILTGGNSDSFSPARRRP